jgi:hypothetical protein
MQTNSTLRCDIIIYYVIHFFVYICFTDKNTDPLMVLKLAKAMILWVKHCFILVNLDKVYSRSFQMNIPPLCFTQVNLDNVYNRPC